MNHDYLSIGEDDKINALMQYASGNTDGLFELIFSNIYRKNEIIQNPDFIFNIFANCSESLKNKVFNILIDYPKVSDTYIIKNDKLKKKDIKFWGADIEKPLVFCLVPYLSDNQCAKLLEKSNIYSMIEHLDSIENREKILVKLFESGKEETIETLKKNYTFFSDIDFDKKRKSITLKEQLFSICGDNYKLLNLLSKITYQNESEIINKWLKQQINKKNEQNINNFIQTGLLDMGVPTQELVVATLASAQSMYSLTFTAVEKMGLKNLKDYKPIYHPLWQNLSNNFSFCKSLLEDGVDPFEFHKQSNSCFFSEIKNHYPQIEIDKNLQWEKLLSSCIDSEDKTYVKFSALCGSYDTALFSTLNQDLSNTRMQTIDKKFKNLSYENLDDVDKLIVIEKLMDKTWFSSSYKSQYSYNKTKTEKTSYAIEVFFVNQYHFQGDIWQINEHLSLLNKLGKNNSTPSFINTSSFDKKYFQALKTLISSNAINNLTEQNNCYLNIAYHIEGNKNLPWAEISELFNSSKIKEDQMNNMGKHLCIYLKQICLSYAFSDKNEKTLKIKI